MYEPCEQMQELDNQEVDMVDHKHELNGPLLHMEDSNNEEGRGEKQISLYWNALEAAEVQQDEKQKNED